MHHIVRTTTKLYARVLNWALMRTAPLGGAKGNGKIIEKYIVWQFWSNQNFSRNLYVVQMHQCTTSKSATACWLWEFIKCFCWRHVIRTVMIIDSNFISFCLVGFNLSFYLYSWWRFTLSFKVFHNFSSSSKFSRISWVWLEKILLISLIYDVWIFLLV